MTVANGETANAATFNGAFMSRDAANTDTVSKVDLLELSTTDLIDVQRIINEIADQNGLANQAATDATAKVYSSTNVVTNGDDQKVAIGKLDGAFDTTTGHDHDGVNSKAVSAADLGDFNNLFAEFRENTFDAASGTSIDVSSLFPTESPGGDAVAEGVITSAPNNFAPIVEKANGGEIEDGEGDRVFSRLTESAGTWTLSFFTNEAGVETAHSLASQDIRFLYREVFTAANRPTIGANVAVYDTQSAIGDIPDATATQRGVVSTSAQTFAGVKEFASRPTTNSIDIVDVSVSQTLTNKKYLGGTASATNKTVVSKDTTANLNSLAREAGSLYFSTSENIYKGDDGTSLIDIGGGAGGFPTLFLKDEKSSGTQGGTFTSGSYQTRTINVSSGDTTHLVSLSANVFVLDAGDYRILASATASEVNSHKLRLRNTTANTDLVIGMSGKSSVAEALIDKSTLTGEFTVAASQNLEIQHRSFATKATTGFGRAVTFGDVETYLQASIIKIG